MIFISLRQWRTLLDNYLLTISIWGGLVRHVGCTEARNCWLSRDGLTFTRRVILEHAEEIYHTDLRGFG